MTEATPDDVLPDLWTASPKRIVGAFAWRGLLWALVVVVVVACLSGYLGVAWLGILPAAVAGTAAGAVTGVGVALATRMSSAARARYRAAAIGGASGAGITTALLGVWWWPSIELVYVVAAVALVSGVAAPVALLRVDGVRRTPAAPPWIVAGAGLATVALLLYAFRGGTDMSSAEPAWAFVAAAIAALGSAAALIVGLARRDRADPQPRLSESDVIWSLVALGMLVLGIASIVVLIRAGAPTVGS